MAVVDAGKNSGRRASSLTVAPSSSTGEANVCSLLTMRPSTPCMANIGTMTRVPGCTGWSRSTPSGVRFPVAGVAPDVSTRTLASCRACSCAVVSGRDSVSSAISASASTCERLLLSCASSRVGEQDRTRHSTPTEKARTTTPDLLDCEASAYITVLLIQYRLIYLWESIIENALSCLNIPSPVQQGSSPPYGDRWHSAN